MTAVSVIGGGAWGTALATVARRAGNHVRLWAREPEVVAAINETHENSSFLKGISLDSEIEATDDLAAAAAADALLLVVPSQFLRGACAELAKSAAPATPILICSKGIELETGNLMTEVVAGELPQNPLAVLSGPTFAKEVANGLPTGVTLACTDQDLAARLGEMIGTPAFRPYFSDDLIGAEIGGAVKNVIAIGCGVVTGRKMGDNARAALITRGLNEMARFGAAKGADPETLMGLSGLGDLTLTCNGEQSRNMSLGMALGRGETLEEVLGRRNSVAEGVANARSVAAAAETLGVDMPIVGAVKAILHDKADIDTVIADLLSRPFRSEAIEG